MINDNNFGKSLMSISDIMWRISFSKEFTCLRHILNIVAISRQQ